MLGLGQEEDLTVSTDVGDDLLQQGVLALVEDLGDLRDSGGQSGWVGHSCRHWLSEKMGAETIGCLKLYPGLIGCAFVHTAKPLILRPLLCHPPLETWRESKPGALGLLRLSPTP